MIRLVYSNRTEELLAALVEQIGAERAARGPFVPVRLVVPNRNIETYVKYGLAARTGIAANLEITFLQRLAERLARDVAPGAHLLEARRIEGYLLALLHDEALLATPALASVREYIDGASGVAAGPGRGAEVARDRRRSALAAELGRLFDEYAASRPELLAAFRGGKPRARGDEALGALGTIETWQRALFAAAFAPGGLMHRHTEAEGAPPDLMLADLARLLEGAPAAPPGGAALHVFGVSYIARAYHQLLAALARTTEVHLYTLNPCREFWEDVDSVPELRRRLKREGRLEDFPARDARQATLAFGADPYGLESARENLALRLWGRPGRENIRLLNDRTGGDFVGRFVESGRRTTLLGQLQDDILDRVVPGTGDSTMAARRRDDSLTVLPCPGVRRELEVIAAEIWRAVDADPTLKLNDVAVIIPEAVKDAYLAHVGAVFAEAHDLPHTAIDLPLGRSSRIAEALLLLLELPFGNFTRRELLPLVTHPAVMSPARFPEARPAEWLQLAEELGIVHGADHGDHAGTYIERDVLNWDQGIKRVALGAFIDPIDVGEGTPVALDGQEYLPLARTPDERRAALQFCALVRSLIADARFAAGITGPRLRPLSQWSDFVRGLCAAYLVPDGPEDEALLARCLDELGKLEALPLGPTPIGFRVAADLLAGALGASSGGRGQYLAHGVTVTSFVPMRAVPFRLVFVAGLGERAFPSSSRRSELDLRAAAPQAGDVTPRQRDLYMFLETLLSTRERLVLSYVARDELTGAPLQPSSVLLELREIVAGYLPATEVSELFEPRTRPPLRRYDDAARAGLSLLATREAQAKALGQSLRAALPPGTATPDLGALAHSLDAATFAALGQRLEAHSAPAGARRGPGRARIVVPLEALRRFLEDPLQGSARFRLRMRETVGDDELVDREDEPFESDRLLRAGQLRDAMLDALFARPELPDSQTLALALRARAAQAELRGQGPTGLYAAAEAPGQRVVLEGWLAELQALSAGAPLAPAFLRYGRPTLRTPHPVIASPPVTLEIPAPEGHGEEPLIIEIVGRSELKLGADATASVNFTSRRDNAAVRIFRDRLRVFVDHVVRAAAGHEAAHTSHVVWSYGDRHATATARFSPLPAAVARDYLGQLVGQLLAGASTLSGWASGLHPYLLPCEAVFEARAKRTSIVEEVEKLRDHYFERAWLTFSSVNGPVPQAVERHDPPSADEAAHMAATRFDLYFDLLESNEKEAP